MAEGYRDGIDPPADENVVEALEILIPHVEQEYPIDWPVIVARALARIAQSGGVDEAHHKAWTIDHVVRILTGPGYARFVAWKKDGEDGPETYTWDEGIPP